ncbi:MAG TPA: DNA-binding domain-containing protein [Candidatus Binataceae bacterium]
MGQDPTDPIDPDLKDLQALLYRLITAPEGVAAGLAAERAPWPRTFDDLERLIESDDRLSAGERLEIYANAYFYRILDCLKEDFPATLATLGADNFHNLVTGYLIEYPPTEPSISHAGRYLSEFLRNHPFTERWPFIADLARLERALIEVFHAPDAEPLGAPTIRSVAPEDWPGLEMRAHPALAIVNCEWRVDEFLRAVETPADGAAGSPQAPARSPVSVLVWRRASQVHYRALEHPERAALELVRAGTNFAAVCEAIAAAAADCDSGEPVALINRLFARWLGDGVLILAHG